MVFGIGEAIAAGVNIKMAREQMDFQRTMSNTAMQRRARDLEKAGLNRILAITQGQGASTPPGARAEMKDPLKDAATTAIQIAKFKSEKKVIDETAQQSIEQQKLIQGQTTAANAQAKIQELGVQEAQNRHDIFAGPGGELASYSPV